MRPKSTIVSMVYPAQNPQLMKLFEQRQLTVLALDAVPRTLSRSQAYDTLSSQANVAGYRAVVEAGHVFGRMFPPQMTAAGKTPQAKVMVVGGGVAGLAAVQTAKNMGARVFCFDTRPAVEEQVKSLGGEFLKVSLNESGDGVGGYAKEMSDAYKKAQEELFRKVVPDMDVVITTALIPGRPAPKLITKEMVEAMRTGSVVVDLASEAGGNCELTVPGESKNVGGRTIIGYTDLPSRLPAQSSTLFSNNVTNLFLSMAKPKGTYVLDPEDPVVRSVNVVREGTNLWPTPIPPAPAPPPPKPAAAAAHGAAPADPWGEAVRTSAFTTAGLGSIVGLSMLGPGPASASMVTKWGLATLAGFQSVWSVKPALHSPLMSVTNAISGISAVGGLVLLSDGLVPTNMPEALAAGAVLASAVNIAGGFLVTHRMCVTRARLERPSQRADFRPALLLQARHVQAADRSAAVHQPDGRSGRGCGRRIRAGCGNGSPRPNAGICCGVAVLHLLHRLPVFAADGAHRQRAGRHRRRHRPGRHAGRYAGHAGGLHAGCRTVGRRRPDRRRHCGAHGHHGPAAAGRSVPLAGGRRRNGCERGVIHGRSQP